MTLLWLWKSSQAVLSLFFFLSSDCTCGLSVKDAEGLAGQLEVVPLLVNHDS